MKTTLILILILLAKVGVGQFPADDSIISKSKSFLELRKKFDTVILYRSYSSWNYLEPYSIVAIGNNTKAAFYKFSLPNSLQKSQLNIDSLNSLVKIFSEFDLFGMKDTKNWMDSCINDVPMCGDCSEFEFVIATKNKFKALYFYEPWMVR
jgi:hypothetical protein